MIQDDTELLEELKAIKEEMQRKRKETREKLDTMMVDVRKLRDEYLYLDKMAKHCSSVTDDLCQ